MLKIALSLLTLVGLAQDKVSFEWKPVAGTSAEYKSSNKHKMDTGTGEEELLLTWTTKITVDKVENGRVWLKSENGEPTATIGGEPANMDVEIRNSTEEHGLNGKLYKDANYGGLGFGLYGGFMFPSSAVAPGESYEVEGLKAKYVGVEKVGEWEGHKFSYEYREKSDGPWSSGQIWFSTKDLSLLRREMVLHGVDFGDGPMDISNDMVRTK